MVTVGFAVLAFGLLIAGTVCSLTASERCCPSLTARALPNPPGPTQSMPVTPCGCIAAAQFGAVLVAYGHALTSPARLSCTRVDERNIW